VIQIQSSDLPGYTVLLNLVPTGGSGTIPVALFSIGACSASLPIPVIRSIASPAVAITFIAT
jgi:hypothetical protein